MKFNPFLPAFRSDPYPTYHYLRTHDPVHKIRGFTRGWLLTRYTDAIAVLGDRRFVVDDLPDRLEHKGSQFKHWQSFDVLRQTIGQWLFFLNPPDHTRLRSLVSKAFSPSMVERLRPQIQTIVNELIANVHQTGKMDLMADFARPLPALVTAQLLGISAHDREQLVEWAIQLFRVFDQPLSLEEYGSLELVAQEMRDYFRDAIATKAVHPQDDLLSDLVQIQQQGISLSQDELLSLCTMLFSVGQETTENLIGNGMLALLHHPEQLTQIKQDPSLITSAVEELMRYDSPVQLIGRDVQVDVEIGGKRICAGEKVIVCLGAANRDPAQFPDPDRLDFSRCHRPLPFGTGIHYCLGAALARVQGQVAISTLIQTLPQLALSPAPLEWRGNLVLRGLKSLNVTFAQPAPLSYG
ncbi:MAG: cytochrome P450 [Cyanobacteria bacterium P01_E01_bin.6]